MFVRWFLTLLSLLLACAAAPWPALAQKQEREGSSGNLAEVGKGRHLGRQDLKPGAYITPRHRNAVQAYLARNHGPGKPCLPGLQRQADRCVAAEQGGWRIGVPLGAAAATQPLPPGLLAALPPAPPGNEYLLRGADILLVASQSRIVVDAVPAKK